jgi:hypothetical protein
MLSQSAPQLMDYIALNLRDISNFAADLRLLFHKYIHRKVYQNIIMDNNYHSLQFINYALTDFSLKTRIGRKRQK